MSTSKSTLPDMDELFPKEAPKASLAPTPVESVEGAVQWDSLDAEMGLLQGVSHRIYSMLTIGIRLEEVGLNLALPQETLERVAKNEAFISLVKAGIVAKHRMKNSIDSMMDNIEHKALFSLSASIENMKPGELLATFKVVNAAKRHTAGTHETRYSDPDNLELTAIGEEEIELEVLPPLVPKTVFSDKGALLEVNGRSLNTMTLAQLEEEAENEDQKAIKQRVNKLLEEKSNSAS